MKRSHGLRVGTRSILRRRRSERSRINISRVMHDYAAVSYTHLTLPTSG